MAIQLHRFGKGKAAKVGGARDTYRPHKSLDKHAWSLTYPTYSSKRPEKKGGDNLYLIYIYSYSFTPNWKYNGQVYSEGEKERREDTICTDRLFLLKAAKGNL